PESDCYGTETQAKTIPPLTWTSCPVINPLSSLAKKLTASAISLGSAARPMGIFSVSWRHSVSVWPVITRAVSVSPGAIALTRTPEGASSNAKDLVNAMIAALAAAYAVLPGLPVMPKFEEVLIMMPHFRSFIGLITAWQQRNVPFRLTSITSRQSDNENSWISLLWSVPPARLTSTS